MSGALKFILVCLSGLLFTAGDLLSRHWAQQPSSFVRILLIAIVGTSAYLVFGILTRHAEFSRVSIWVSISLTSTSCLAGILFFGDDLSKEKILAFFLALTAAYFSVK